MDAEARWQGGPFAAHLRPDPTYHNPNPKQLAECNNSILRAHQISS